MTDAPSIALIANGSIHDYRLMASLIAQYDRKIAVDGGLDHCHAMGIIPDLIIGDLDSANLETLSLYPNVPKKIFPAEKDYSDMELALRAAISGKVKKLGIFGAMEKRVDHALSNLYLLRRLPGIAVIETDQETITYVTGNQSINCKQNQVISLIPLEDQVSGVTTRGLKWELNDVTLTKDFFSLSNICLNSFFEINIQQGSLLCCLVR